MNDPTIDCTKKIQFQLLMRDICNNQHSRILAQPELVAFDVSPKKLINKPNIKIKNNGTNINRRRADAKNFGERID